MIKLYKLLLEIGDSSPYKFTMKDIDLDGVSLFHFTTKSGLKYELSISIEDIPEQGITAIANFDVLPDIDQAGDKQDFAMTNKFEMLPILSTVFGALKDMVNKNPKIKSLQFSAKQEESEKGDDSNRRRNIYIAYVQKLFPGSTITQKGKDTIVKLQ